MLHWKRALGYGFLLWLIPFLAALMLSAVRASNRIFFETLMPVVITLCCVGLTFWYLRQAHSRTWQHGIVLGGLWMLISIVIDLGMFSFGPMAMPFSDYMLDIGLTYLIYPIITTGMASLR